MEDAILDDMIETNQAMPERIEDTDIFRLIWFQPRRVFRYINAYKYDKFVTILLILGGITRGVNRTAGSSTASS